MAHDKSVLAKFDPLVMHEHFERFMRKVYDRIIMECRQEIMERRQASGRGVTEDQAYQDMCLTKMKEKKISVVKEVEKEKDKRIIEYIKYLIGQTANNDFILKREEFS